MSNEATQSANAARPPLDPMFPQLVKEADSPEQKLIGFIAFGLYEEARREWASDFRDREGRYPVENEFRAYEQFLDRVPLGRHPQRSRSAGCCLCGHSCPTSSKLRSCAVL